jgi:hypothetical protein
MAVVDVLHGGGESELGLFQATLKPAVFPFRGFPIDEQCEPVLERQCIALGHLGLFLKRFGHAEQAQFVEFFNRRLVQHDSPPFPGYR